jgi:uncharacterized protein (TIGR00369 family)
MTDLLARIQSSFDRQAMMATLGASLRSVEPGHVVIDAPILPSATQQHGVAHAALTFALGDTAAGYAGLTTLPEDREVMTAEMKINLLAPGRGTGLRATGRVIRPGRRLIVSIAEVHALNEGAETLVAILQGTLIPVDPA